MDILRLINDLFTIQQMYTEKVDAFFIAFGLVKSKYWEILHKQENWYLCEG